MTTCAFHLPSTSSIAARVALLNHSSILLPQRPVERWQATRVAQRLPGRYIAQLNFGRDAWPAVCTEPTGHSVTRKSLAVSPNTPALPMAAIAGTTSVNHAVNAASKTDAPIQAATDCAAIESIATSTAKQHRLICLSSQGTPRSHHPAMPPSRNQCSLSATPIASISRVAPKTSAPPPSIAHLGTRIDRARLRVPTRAHACLCHVDRIQGPLLPHRIQRHAARPTAEPACRGRLQRFRAGDAMTFRHAPAHPSFNFCSLNIHWRVS